MDAPLRALGISEIVDETTTSAARVHAVELGVTLEGRTLVAFGGCAPLHAARVAEKLGLDEVVIPRSAGVGSAVGFLRATIAFEVARSLHQALDALDTGAVNALLAAMTAEAQAIVRLGDANAPAWNAAPPSPATGARVTRSRSTSRCALWGPRMWLA